MGDHPLPGQWKRGYDAPPPGRPELSPHIAAGLSGQAIVPPSPFREAERWAQDQITVLIFTSPVPSHPSDWILRWTFESVRAHLPKSRIWIVADGEGGLDTPAYNEFKWTVRRNGWELIGFGNRCHLTRMLRGVLPYVRTQFVLLQEHDWALRRRFIDWGGIVNALKEGPFKAIQLMQGEGADQAASINGEIVEQCGVKLLPTRAFLVAGCVARKDWLRERAEPLVKAEHLESGPFSDTVFRGVDKVAWYVPTGGAARGHHLNGAGAIHPPSEWGER